MRLIGAILFAITTSLAVAAPECLIVQVNADRESSLWTADDLSAILDTEGRISPIVWSSADPIFSRMNEASRKPYTAAPNERDALRFAAEHKVAYTLILATVRNDKGLLGEAKLFRGGRQIWRDAQTQTVRVEDVGSASSEIESLARIWAIRLGEGPFRELPARTKIPTVEPDPGPVVETPVPPVKTGPAGKRLPSDIAPMLKRADVLAANGANSEAILLLREAIDLDPQNPAARIALVEMLSLAGHREAAADEAMRSADLGEETRRLRLIAAQIYTQLGKIAEAQDALNQSLSQDGDSHLGAVIRGDLAMLKGDFAGALGHYDLALKTRDSKEAILGQLLARGLTGRAPELAEAQKLVATLSVGEKAGLYERAISLVAPRTETLIESVRTTMREGLVSKRSPKIIEQSVRDVELAESLDRLLRAIPVPAKYTGSHKQRELAHKLLVQACSEAVAFAQRGEEDQVTDIAINLGDAVRRFSAAKEDFNAER